MSRPTGGPAGCWLRLAATCFLAAVAAPAAVMLAAPWFGARTVVVAGASMAPALQPGDVVITRPLTDPAALRPGQVVVVSRPGFPGQLLTHRVLRTAAGGVVTKGDANPEADTGTVAARDVLGVPWFVLPAAGRPVLWWRDRTWPPLAGWTLTTVVALVVACGGARPRATERAPTADRTGATCSRER